MTITRKDLLKNIRSRELTVRVDMELDSGVEVFYFQLRKLSNEESMKVRRQVMKSLREARSKASNLKDMDGLGDDDLLDTYLEDEDDQGFGEAIDVMMSAQFTQAAAALKATWVMGDDEATDEELKDIVSVAGGVTSKLVKSAYRAAGISDLYLHDKTNTDIENPEDIPFLSQGKQDGIQEKSGQTSQDQT